MATKKRFKLKKRFRILILLIILIGIMSFFGVKYYNEYMYRQTIDYKILEIGYDENTKELLKKKLSKSNLDYLLNEDKIDYIGDLVGEKYYIDSNFSKYLSYYQENSKKSFSDVVAIVNVGADKKWYQGPVKTDTTDKYNFLVNKFNYLEDFEEGNIKKFSSTYAYGTVSAEETCYDAFLEMHKAAKKDGITLILTSGYRSNEKQTDIYNDMKNKRGEEYADAYAARPGHSEHETGLALDILTYGGLTETFKTTETYEWLHEHAVEYGFIERYQEGKEYLTGYAPEAWHYRYLGKDLAKKVNDEGITYDEYYAFYLAR